ncbi:MAG: hypothetical protein R3B70_46370 [Polyangiaceae bacterium]
MQLHVARRHLRSQPHTFEQGRTFGLLRVSAADLAERIASSRSPSRLLVHADRRSSGEIASRLTELGYRVSTPLALMIGTARSVLQACRRKGAPKDLHDRVGLVRIGPRSPPELVRGIQLLQDASGITPLPGWYMRGVELPVVTLAIVDSRGAPIGAGSIQTIGSGGEGELTAMGLAICVSAPHRGIGLGTWLNRQLLITAVVELGAGFLQEIIDDPASGSRRMNQRCGLVEDVRSHYLFAEHLAMS